MRFPRRGEGCPRFSGPLIVLLTILAPAASGREPGAPLLDLRVERISIDDGLSNGIVRSVAEDFHGFLWLGTLNGLNRWDGYHFQVYKNDPDDPDSLAANEVMEVYEDRQERLWLATRGGGLDLYDRVQERFLHHRHDPDDERSLSHDTVERILEDRGGTLWIGTAAGLNRRNSDGTFVRYLPDPGDPSSLPGALVYALYESGSGDLWVGTDGGLARLDRTSGAFVAYRHDPSDPASLGYNVVRDVAGGVGEGWLWVATERGLDRFDPATATFVHFRHDPADPGSLSNDSVRALYVDSRGELWAATYSGGLNLYHPWSESFAHFRHDPADPQSLSSDLMTRIFESSAGILYFATLDGVSQYDRRREQFVTYRHLPHRSSLSGNGIWALYEDGDGVLWVGTYDSGLNRMEKGRQRVDHHRHDAADPTSLPNDAVTALCEDREGTFWVGTWGGLAVLDRATGRFVRTFRHDPEDPRSLRNDRIVGLREDREGRFWVATQSGLHLYDREDAGFLRFPRDGEDPEGLGRDWFYAIHEDRSGALWLGGAVGGGLYRLDAGAERFVHYTHDPAEASSLSSDKVGSIYEDRAGRMWVGTYGAGLNRLDRAGRGFLHYREKDGLPDENVIAILEDGTGYLWLATFRALARFDPLTETFQTYGVADGLQGEVFSSGSHFKSSSGEMFFGGNRGLNAFFPERVAPDPRRPRPAVTGFQLFHVPAALRRTDPGSPLERSILETRQITLSHRQYHFAFEFAALQYASPRTNRYMYRLQGFDADWIATDWKRRYAAYSNLDPGRYAFRLKSSNGAGVWREAAPVTVVVLPPPWKTWWAILLYAAAAVGLVTGFVRHQRKKVEREREVNRQLREIDRLKDHFLANTSHELRTPLYGIIGLAESLIDGATGELPAATRSNLSMIVSSGRRLAWLVNDILDFSKLTAQSLALDRKSVDLRALADIVLTLSHPLVGGKDLDLRNAVDPDLPPADADENRLQQILINLIGNAVKFTESGSVEVSAEAQDGRLLVRVADTGVGIPEEALDRIFDSFVQVDGSTDRTFSGTGLGLAVTKELVTLHGGTLGVESAPGEGSTFSFTLPVASGAAAALPPADSPAAGVSTSRVQDRGAERAVEVPAPEAPADLGGLEEMAAPWEVFRILLVDDEPINRRVLVNHLSSVERYRLSQAAGGEEALNLLAEDDFDLVLLDVMMPRMSGYEVCRKIREEAGVDELPVIFLTAKNQVSDLVDGFSVGGNDYLTKPIAKGELLARVDLHLALLVGHRRVRRLLKERETQLAVVEEQATELERFTYTVSHDLRSPLLTIQGFLGHLLRNAESGDREALAEDGARIRGAAEDMIQLLDGLLDHARYRHPTRALETLSLGELAHEAVERIAAQAAELGIEVTVSPDLPAALGDRYRILDVMSSLLDNSVKFLGRPRAPRIEVGVRRDDGGDVFFVRDNGIGVERRYHEKIFGLFEQLDARTAGTGLGLALAKRIVEAHGGRIWVESDGAGQGSCFCWTLPQEGLTQPITQASTQG